MQERQADPSGMQFAGDSAPDNTTTGLDRPFGARASHLPLPRHEVPRWLHVGQPPPTGAEAVRLWGQYVQADRGASVHFHPDVALVPRVHEPDAPLVHAQWEPSAAGPRLRSLAVLPTRTLTIPLLPGLPPAIHLRAWRVLESRLLADGDVEQSLNPFIDRLAAALHDHDDGADCVLFQDVDTTSPLRQLLPAACARHKLTLHEPNKPVPHWWIRFPDKPDQYWAQFSKKTRYNFRYRAKHLPHTVRCIRHEEDVPAFLHRVEDFVRRTWQYQCLGAYVAQATRDVEFWRRVAAAGAMRSYLLEHDGRVLAFAIGIQSNGHYAYEETGYDPANAAQSPGQVLLYRVLEDLIAEDTPQLFDFGYGDSDYKRIFANYQTLSGPLMLVRRNWRPLLATKLQRCHTAMGRAARLALASAGLLSTLRRLYRGHHAV